MEDRFARNDYNQICQINNPNDFDQFLDNYVTEVYGGLND
jgi:hypothetical protein